MARREAQRHVCARLQCPVPRGGGAASGGEKEGSRRGAGSCLEEMMCELGLTERVAVGNNNSVLVVIVVSAC